MNIVVEMIHLILNPRDTTIRKILDWPALFVCAFSEHEKLLHHRSCALEALDQCSATHVLA